MMIDVACIGILTADIIAKPVNEIPKNGLLGLIDEITLHNCGCAMSAAIDMAKIGNDSFGEHLKSVLIHNNSNI